MFSRDAKKMKKAKRTIALETHSPQHTSTLYTIKRAAAGQRRKHLAFFFVVQLEEIPTLQVAGASLQSLR